MRKSITSLIYFFPFQLIFYHVRKNLALVILWLLFVATISGGIGRIYGIHYLFLDPEYMNAVGFRSFFLVGLAFGNFTMAFHITCYILDGHRYTFVGVLERPFAKFSINNSLLPLGVLVVYIILIVRFQVSNEFAGIWLVLLDLLGLLLGIVVMLALFFLYFRFTNKDIFRYLAGAVDKRLRKARISRERMMGKLKESRNKDYHVDSYLDLKFRRRSCRHLQDFYDKEAVLKVFDQNHFNSVIIEIAVIVLIWLLGAFMKNPYFQIPAAASCLLMFSILVMLIGAFSYWLKEWAVAAVFGLFLLLNLATEIGLIKGLYQARGIIYDQQRPVYSLTSLRQLNSAQQYTEDSLKFVGIMNNWKTHQQDSLPKMVFLCVSGGGQRAALWTVNALQHCDSVLAGQLMNQVLLITGASGGMIGAAYYRELDLQKKMGQPVAGRKEQLHRMGRDNLNPIIFSLLVNDLFLRIRSFHYEGVRYVQDRGYVFEENLNNNLGGVLDKPLKAYREQEEQAVIPVLLMSPVISNDGRSLRISPLSTTFMNVDHAGGGKVRGVDFGQLFAESGSEELNFLTALRMSASFPYITPTVSLPSQPSIEIMDAGISDNFGVEDALRFIYVFHGWLEQNTSGVVLLTVRDTRKNAPVEPKSNPSIVQNLTYPIASVYNNLGNIQDITNEANVELMRHSLKIPLETVDLEYNTYTNIDEEYLLEAKEIERKQLERASLSWHLTTKEKKNIIDNIQFINNQQALKKLELLLNP